MEGALGLIETPKIKWSSRPVVSVFLVIFSIFFLCWSKLSNVGLEGNLENSYGHLWILNIVLLLPIISWSIFELFRLVPHLKRRWSYMIACIGVIISPKIFLIFKAVKAETEYIKHYAAALIISAIVLFILANLIYGRIGLSDYDDLRRKNSLRSLLMCAHLFWNSLIFLVWISNLTWTAIIIFFTMANDSCAYLFGKIFGKRHIFKCSPSKTLEGFLITAIVLPFAYQIVSLVLPDLSNMHSSIKTDPQVFIFIPFIIPLIASAGDLFFSAQKRVFKTKDYGRIFGEQGGFWDRFDSHTFVLSFFCVSIIILKSINA